MKQSYLKSILSYDSETGIFVWKISKGKRVKAGDIAGAINGAGYIQIRIDGKIYKAHRLAWLYIYGAMPVFQIDHKDHNRANNKIDNLRVVTNLENGKNHKLHKNNKSGTSGVYWYKNRSRWRARIVVNSKDITLGYFKNKKDAIKARKEAEKKYGFHENHGKKEI